MAGKAIIALAAALVVSGTAIAEDQPPEVLTRTKEWVVSSDQNGCHLSAGFGSGDAQVTAQFTRYQPGDTFDLMLSGKRFLDAPGIFDSRPDTPDYRSITLDFGATGGVPIQRIAWHAIADQLPALMFTTLRLDGWKPPVTINQQPRTSIVWLPDPKAPEKEIPDPASLAALHAAEKAQVPPPAPDISPAQEASVTGLTLSIPAKPPLRLAFGSLAQPFTQMRDCMDKLVRSWGYKPETIRTLSRPLQPIIPERSWFSSNDYPTAPWRRGHNGSIPFRLDVDVQGRVTDCHILTRINPEDIQTNILAKATCRLVSARVNFIPALDAQGQPIKTFYVSRMNWIYW